MATQQAEAVEAEEKTADEDVAAVDAPTPDAVCRLCGESSPDCVHIFGEEGKALGLYEKCSHCLPVLVRGKERDALFVYSRRRRRPSQSWKCEKMGGFRGGFWAPKRIKWMH